MGMGRKSTSQESEVTKSELIYDIGDAAPWHITLMYICQQLMSLAPGAVSTATIIHGLICGGDDYGFLGELVGIMMFMLGIGTILQITFGVRLPILQGSSWVFIAPLTSIMSSEKYKCPEISDFNTTAFTATTASTEPEWRSRICVVSGSLIVASAVQVVLSLTGAVGALLPYIGPLTISPAMALLGLSLYPSVIRYAQANWGIAVLVVALYLLFSAVLRDVKIPFPSFSIKRRKLECSESYYVFRHFPKVLTVCIAWLLCYVLTITNVFTDDPNDRGYKARTDVKWSAIEHSTWLYFPVPGRWGQLTVDLGIVTSLTVASFMGMVESIGDYYILARACEKPTPPRHAVNRGLAVEGIVNMICGALGMGHGTASYSATTAFLKITGIASRQVWQILGLSLIVMGIVGKIGGALAMIPDPILGGSNVIGLGLLIMTGLSNLQFVNMNSSRNLLTMAVSLMLGMTLPFWLLDNPDIIKTGSNKFDEILTGMLSSAIFVGAILGFTLDNLIPGTKKDRGLLAYQSHLGMNDGDHSAADYKVYDLPLLSSARCKGIHWCTYIPFLPWHKHRECHCCCGRNRESKQHKPDDTVDSGVISHIVREENVTQM